MVCLRIVIIVMVKVGVMVRSVSNVCVGVIVFIVIRVNVLVIKVAVCAVTVFSSRVSRRAVAVIGASRLRVVRKRGVQKGTMNGGGIREKNRGRGRETGRGEVEGGVGLQFVVGTGSYRESFSKSFSFFLQPCRPTGPFPGGWGGGKGGVGGVWSRL